MPLLSKTFIGSLLIVTAAGGARAHAGVASAASQQILDQSFAEIGRTTAGESRSVYAPPATPIDVTFPQRAIDVPTLKSLPISDGPARVRNHTDEPAVEPVPAPNSMALGLVMLGIIAFARIVRRFKLA
jgi:hypothetical protein